MLFKHTGSLNVPRVVYPSSQQFARQVKLQRSARRPRRNLQYRENAAMTWCGAADWATGQCVVKTSTASVLLATALVTSVWVLIQHFRTSSQVHYLPLIFFLISSMTKMIK